MNIKYFIAVNVLNIVNTINIVPKQTVISDLIGENDKTSKNYLA